MNTDKVLLKLLPLSFEETKELGFTLLELQRLYELEKEGKVKTHFEHKGNGYQRIFERKEGDRISTINRAGDNL